MLAVQEWVESLNFINKTKYAMHYGAPLRHPAHFSDNLSFPTKKKKAFLKCLKKNRRVLLL